MSTSVWPNDTFNIPEPPIDQKGIDTVTCFVVSPFEPRKRWDDLFRMVQTVATQVGESHGGIVIKCYRADDIASSGIIHPEIWNALRTADFIVCDVSGGNGNVMLELGVASAWRCKEHVIILRDKSDEQPHFFDINPARHLEYEISFFGMQKLAADLRKVISEVLAAFPFENLPSKPLKLPFHATLDDGRDAPELLTEDITHRRMLAGCLEFGTPLTYRHSWMSLSNLSLTRVHVKADMRVTLAAPISDLAPFMGIMVRGQSYFANFGHLVFVRDGQVYLTVRDDTGESHDELLGAIPNFDINAFTHFDISIDDNVLCAKVNEIEVSKNLVDLPYVFSAGRVIFIAGYCRVGIKNIAAESL